MINGEWLSVRSNNQQHYRFAGLPAFWICRSQHGDSCPKKYGHGNFHGTRDKPWDFSVHRFQTRPLQYNPKRVSFRLHPLDTCGNQLAKWLAVPTTVKFPKWLVFGIVLGHPSEILNGNQYLRNTQTQLVVDRAFATRSWWCSWKNQWNWLALLNTTSWLLLVPSLLWNIDQALALSS